MGKRIFCIRFPKRELGPLRELAESLGLPSRSRLVNLALEKFLDSSAEQIPASGERRVVKVLLDPKVKERLEDVARQLRTSKAELVRIALNEFAEQNQASVVHENSEP